MVLLHSEAPLSLFLVIREGSGFQCDGLESGWTPESVWASAPSPEMKRTGNCQVTRSWSSGAASLKLEMLTFMPTLKETKHLQALLSLGVRWVGSWKQEMTARHATSEQSAD